MANWYLENGKESDIVVSTRIRLARNVEDFPFKIRETKEQKKQFLEQVKYITPSLGYGLRYFELKDMDDITKMSLVEKHIISPDIVLEKQQDTLGILLNEEENICIMLNEEDHFRIQVFCAGLDLQNTMNLAIEIDEKLANQFHYACNKTYGYLTACPTNVGTGLRASVMVHLPALKLTGNITKILHVVNNFGMSIRGVYGEDTQSKEDMYQISNNQTLGISEKEIIANLENITRKVIEQERLARKYLTKNKLELEDRVYRSYGILTNAVKLDSEECAALLSDVKLGTDLGIIEPLKDSKVKQLELYTKPANLQKYTGKVLNGYDRDVERAKVIKQIIKQD
ncbi:MAG: protein arginine kinase [Clostridia bacterium]